LSAPSLLIVDDEALILLALKAVLGKAGYIVYTAKDAFEAIDLLEKLPFDVILVDLRLPGPTGLSLVERIQVMQPTAAVVMMSGNATHQSIIEALRLLKHRPQPIVGSQKPAELVIGPLSINMEQRIAVWHDEMLTLTPTEFALIHMLAQHAGQSVAPAALIRRCRGYATTDDEARFLLKPHIANLRQKLEQDGRFERVLLNHRGVGFVLRLPLTSPAIE
jgi:DNA-binding response OmpR family regulator